MPADMWGAAWPRSMMKMIATGTLAHRSKWCTKRYPKQATNIVIKEMIKTPAQIGNGLRFEPWATALSACEPTIWLRSKRK